MWMVPRRLSRSTSSCFLSSSNLEIISPCPPRQALSNLKRRRINAFFLPNSDRNSQMALKFFKNPLIKFRPEKLMNTKEIVVRGLFFIAEFLYLSIFLVGIQFMEQMASEFFPAYIKRSHLLLRKFFEEFYLLFFSIERLFISLRNKGRKKSNSKIERR